MTARRITRRRRRRRHRRPRPRRRRPRRARRRATSSSTPPPRCRSTRRSTARSRSTCSARPASPQTLQRPRRHARTSSPCRPATSPATAGARAPEELVDESPFFVDVDWRREVDGARRARRDAEAESRTPEQLAEFRKRARARARRRRQPAARGEDRAAPHAVGRRPHGRGRPRPCRVARLARRLRLHQGARRAGAARDPRRRARSAIVRPSIIESALAEPRPGWIRGFRMAEPVIISYARGLLKEFPGVPEGIVDVIPVDLVAAAIIARRRRGPAADDADVVQVASGSVNPLRYRRLVDLVQRLVHRAPALRRQGPADRRARVVVPRPRSGAGPARRGPRTRSNAPRSVLQPLPLRGKQAEWWRHARGEARRGRARARLRRALRRVRRVRGGLRRRSPARAVGLARPTTTSATFCFDPRVDRLGQLRHRHPPAVGRRPRPRAHHARRPHRRSPRGPPAPPGARRPIATSRRSTSRTRSSPRTWWRRTRGWPPAACPPTTALRFVLKTLAEAPSLLALDRKDRSDFLRFFYRRYDGAPVDQIDEDAAEMFSELILAKSFPAAIRRVREHRALGHRTVLITGALDFVVKPLAPALRRHRRAPRMAVRRRPRTPASSPTCRRPARAAAQALMDYADATASTCASRSPTPTRPATCPCSRPSASPWRSTPRPAWPRWPASAAGSSRTSPRPTAAPRRSLPIGPRRRRTGGLANRSSGTGRR